MLHFHFKLHIKEQVHYKNEKLEEKTQQMDRFDRFIWQFKSIHYS